MARDKNIKPDVGKLNVIYELIPEDKRIIAEDLIKEIYFIAETLDQLKKNIKETGIVERFEQGKQNFMRENPALKSYNTTIQRYCLVYKQLTDLIPKKENKPGDDDFDNFTNGRDYE